MTLIKHLSLSLLLIPALAYASSPAATVGSNNQDKEFKLFEAIDGRLIPYLQDNPEVMKQVEAQEYFDQVLLNKMDQQCSLKDLARERKLLGNLVCYLIKQCILGITPSKKSESQTLKSNDNNNMQ